jgi:uncharacterized damage-inducible protein DinB
MVADLEDPRRRDVDYILGERDMLEAWLEFHRVTLVLKCEGLDDAGRKARPVASSELSLHGLVRHMAEVERSWFRRCLLRDRSAPYIFCLDRYDGSDLSPLDQAIWEHDVATWETECEASRRTAADRGLDDTGIRDGKEVSLRWIYFHMIEEYSRHNGHADLIREMLDGAVGC